MPPSLALLRSVAAHCAVEVPDALEAQLTAAGDDPEAVRVAGREYMEQVCRGVLEPGAGEEAAPGLYIYSLNLEKSASEIVANLGLARGDGSGACGERKPLPFQRPRENEKVRPIFWASNPMSYLARTRTWVSGAGAAESMQMDRIYSTLGVLQYSQHGHG